MRTTSGVAAVARLRRSARRGAVPGRILLVLDRAVDLGRQRNWRHVTSHLLRTPATRVSVDVFDTVLTRRVAGDTGVWWVTAHALMAQGAWSGTARDFLAARRAAAQAGPEDDLPRLYQRPQLAAGVRHADGAAIESAVELELAVPVPDAKASLRQLRAAGHRVTFLSDMHLERQEILTSLERHGLMTSGDELVVSTQVGASKSGGDLFPLLRSRDQGSTWHIGNDLWSDVAMAERAGILAFPMRAAEPNRLEQLMTGPPGSVGAAIAGAALQVRLFGASSSDAAALHEVGADVAGQCLSAFLLWIRAQAEASGLGQLCFLARDGELPLAMARAMPADHWEAVKLTYLHGSRRLWSGASLAVVGVDAWLEAGLEDADAFLRQNQHAIPWHSLLSRALLDPSDLPQHGALATLALEAPLPERLDGEWRALLADEALRIRLLLRAQEQLAHLREVLAADGVGPSRVGLVDVGWRGQLAWQVSAVLKDVTGHEPVHLHFGGVGVSAHVQADIRRFAVDDSKHPLPFPDFVSCVETITASGAARAKGTERRDDGEVRLVFDAALPQMDTEERRLLWTCAVDVARLLPSRRTLRRWGLHLDGLHRPVVDVLSAFWTAPTLQHGRAGTQLAAEVDDGGHSVIAVASSYRFEELLGSTRPARTWRQGSLAVTPAPLRHLARMVLCVKDRRRQR